MAEVVDVTFEVEAIDGGVRLRLGYTAVLQPWETGVWFTEVVVITPPRRKGDTAAAQARATVTSPPFVIAARVADDVAEPVRRQRRLPPVDIVEGAGGPGWALRPRQQLTATITLAPCEPRGASGTGTAKVPSGAPRSGAGR